MMHESCDMDWVDGVDGEFDERYEDGEMMVE